MLLMLVKAKYIKRWRDKEGKYRYLYKLPKGRQKQSNDIESILHSVYDNILSETRELREKVVVLDSNGNKLMEKIGSRNYVTFTPEEIEKIKKCKYLVHNHPSNMNFSLDDIVLAMRQKIPEMHIVSGVRICRLKINHEKIDLDSFLDAYKEKSISFYDLLKEKVYSGELSPYEGNIQYTDGLVKWMVETYPKVFSYSEQKRMKKSMEDLEKAKFIRKYRDKNGRWRYVYKEPKGRKKNSDIIPPNKFKAKQYFEAFNDPNVTPKDIIERVEKKYPKVASMVKEVEEKIRSIKPSIAKYKISEEGLIPRYSTERRKLHEKIINSFLNDDSVKKALPEPGQKPTILFLGGRGGSGKSWFKGNGYDPEKAIVIDPDEIKAMLPEYEGWNAAEVHEEASDITDQIIYSCFSLGLNVVLDATMKMARTCLGLIDVAKKKDYNIEALYMFVPRQISSERALLRFASGYEKTGKGRYVPLEVLLGNTTNEETFDQVKPFCRRWAFYDNQGDPPPKLVSKFEGKAKVRKAMKYFEAILLKAESSDKKEDSKKDLYEDGWNPNVIQEYEKNTPEHLRKLIDRLKVARNKRREVEKSYGGHKYIYKKWYKNKWHYVYKDLIDLKPKMPTDFSDLKIKKNLGGSTGAYLVDLPNGKQGVLKAGGSVGQAIEEATANSIYEVLGVPVPKTWVGTYHGRPAMIHEYIPGKVMSELTGEERKKAEEFLKKHFVVDALLGNWDVLGLAFDNIIWDGNTAWRIDNGGALRYRAQGKLKGENFNPVVIELDTMRDPNTKAGRVYKTVTDEEVKEQIQKILPLKEAILTAIDDSDLRKTMEKRINSLAQFGKSLYWNIPDYTILHKGSNSWVLIYGHEAIRFYWFNLEKAQVQIKKYYTPEEVRAMGMRWVTIRGAHVLIRKLKDGGYVVVGGAGGALNHLKIDKLLTEKEYKVKQKEVESKKKEKLKELSEEEYKEYVKQRKIALEARRDIRNAYMHKIQSVLGVSDEELKARIDPNRIKEIIEEARGIAERKAIEKELSDEEKNKIATKETEKRITKEKEKQIKNVERAAVELLMNDLLPEDPNIKERLTNLLDADKAKEILVARKEFRKRLKELGTAEADVTQVKVKIGSVFAGATQKDLQEIEKEIREQAETQKNIALYNLLDAQAESIQKYVDEGSAHAINGFLGDVFGTGAVFSTETISVLGVNTIARTVAAKILESDKADVIKKALQEYANQEREKVVDATIEEVNRRMQNAEELRKLAQDTEDAEALLSMASANGHALKQIVAAQRQLGSAIGSLRAVAHILNALEEPIPDTIQVDIGNDLARAREKARKAGLLRKMYKIKVQDTEKGGKRLILEIPRSSLNSFFKENQRMRVEEDKLTRIKAHKENNGYKPPGIKESIKLDAAQEAGLRFFKEKKRVLLDFEAGLGKTAVAYAAAMEAMSNMGAKKVLIVTPAKLRRQMYEERQVFLDEDKQKLVNFSEGSKEKRLKAYEKEGITIIGHDQLRTDIEAIKKAGYDMIVVDEIHQMTSGGGAADRFKGMMELKDIPLRIGMSGTNIVNSKEELYRKINFIDPQHTLGSLKEFKKKYKGLNQSTGMFMDAANEAFKKEVAEWVYTQKNKLPVKNEIKRVLVPLTPAQRKRYAESERIYRQERDQGLIGAAARRDARNYAIISDQDPSDNGKINKIVETMKTNHPNEKAVIHVYGIEPMNAVKKRLEQEFGEGCVGLIHGESKESEISEIRKSFNDPNGKIRFIVGTKSLESGHNLQHGANITFHLDIPDSYAAFDQRNKRVYRKGQTRDTITYMLSGNNPLDMRKEDILNYKKREMSILGNPREVESADETGFLGLLNKYEKEATSK